jgi:hypothetical protein
LKPASSDRRHYRTYGLQPSCLRDPLSHLNWPASVGGLFYLNISWVPLYGQSSELLRYLQYLHDQGLKTKQFDTAVTRLYLISASSQNVPAGAFPQQLVPLELFGNLIAEKSASSKHTFMRMNGVKPRAPTNGLIGMASAGSLSVIPAKSYYFGRQDSRALTFARARALNPEM